MAIYDKSADSASAVTAFLNQFKVFANGNIRFVSGTDTFHIWWLHRALQKIAWDFSISGDDEINLAKPNPSTSEALGTIITLLDHTAAFSISYNIDDTVSTYLFGGSVEQSSGAELYAGLKVLGSVNSATQLQIIQNNGLLTSHWGAGKNQTDSATLLRILVKVTSASADIDGKRVIVKANEWGDSYAVWRTALGLGEGVAAINTVSDPQNDTLVGTVNAYTGITNVEGYQQIDIGNGSGVQPYLSKWAYGANDKKKLYEWVKSLLVRGSAATIYGLDGDIFTGVTTTFAYDGLTLTFTEPEQVTWATGSGQLMADSGSRIWLQILTGINPVDNDVITGGTSGASCSVAGAVTSLTPDAHHLGTFTGSAWIGAFGIGFDANELVAADSVKDLDGDIMSPPNNVPISVSVTGATAPHVMLARNNGSGGILYAEYTAAAGNNTGNGTFVISEAIKSDTPQAGFLLVKEGTSFEPIEYSSWEGSTFTLVGTLGGNYTAAKEVFVPFLYKAATGGSDPRVASTSVIYNASVDVIGWVRHGDPTSPDKPVNISGTIGVAGLTLSVQLEDE